MRESAGLRPRRAALEILEQVRQGLPFDAALGRGVEQLAERDRRLAHELAAGVLRQRSSLDVQLEPLVSRPWHSVAPELQNILRLGAYQILLLERVPSHAAVDTSVALARTIAGDGAAGFVNAVLRRLSRSGPQSQEAPRGTADRLASEYSHPLWMVQRWIAAFGLEQTEGLLRWNNSRPRLVAQPARQSLEQVAESWNAAGMDFQRAPYNAGLIAARSRPAELPGYREGGFIIQDPAQGLLVRYIDPPADAKVYDACAAPGGKTVALGRRTAMVVSGEIKPLRARRLSENLRRAGSGREHVIVADARHPPVRALEIVLLDAPCLGSGTIARHPDARWRMTPRGLKHMAELQAELLNSTADVVKPGGLLVYSTCSVEREENLDQIERFLQRHRHFQRDAPADFPESLLSPKGDLLILPQIHGMDGAYAARLRRSA